MNSNPTPSAPPVKLGVIVKIVIVLVIIGLIVGLVPRWKARQALVAEARTDSVLTVSVVAAVPSKPDFGTPLPAEVQPFIQAEIHSRASGYLTNWYVDIGEAVTNGQVLAEIDTPELDQQLLQARAELDQAKAALALAKITADRWVELLKTASVSEQETAEKTSDLTLKQAEVEAADANLQRLQQTKDFDRLTAPFAGIVTLRNTDIGQLITANSGAELFRVAQMNPLRVYVRVPQPLIHSIFIGQTAQLTFQELPGRTFEAKVIRTSGAVDQSSRTLQVELQVDNAKGEILSGSYAQARFNEAAETASVLTLTDTALLFRAQGMQIAIVDSDNKVQLHSVKLGRDFGNTVEVLAGLNADDRVINNPPDSIMEGQPVEIAKPAETNTPAK
ncbi:MAG TPA: efflux RND transporter periplasmic adaptor subunit [Verrucomicrobiae bacterium]|jgi:RND family efflux transporter MFP subunit